MVDIIRAFKDKIFEATTMTEKVNKLPFQPNYLQSLGLFKEEPIYTPSFAMSSDEGALTLLPTVARGAPLPDWKPKTGEVRTFETTRIGEGSTITADELMPMLQDPNGNTLKTLVSETTKRQVGILADINVTQEHHILGAIQGKVLDSDGTTVIADWYDAWNIVPPAEVAMDLPNADVDAIIKIVATIREQLVLARKGLRWNGSMTAVIGRTFAHQLFYNPKVMAFYANTPAYAKFIEGPVDGFATMEMFGIKWVQYQGMDAGSPLNVPDDKAFLFPSDRNSQIFRVMRAPTRSLKQEFQGKKGRALYSFRDIDPNDRQEWVRIEMETNPMYVNMRPEMLRTLRAGA